MEQEQSINELFAAADAAVYLAKNEGRNRVRSHMQMPLQIDFSSQASLSKTLTSSVTQDRAPFQTESGNQRRKPSSMFALQSVHIVRIQVLSNTH